MKIRFVVTGRPNKGKSSLVATLAQSDAVAIAAQSGTTRHAETHRIRAGGHSIELVDTPGLQRPEKVRAWLQQHAGATGAGAHQRRGVLEAFIADPANRERYPDETRILQAMLDDDCDATAIIYVVDSSVPFHRSYEDEMSILQWTGLLSVAIINPVVSEEFIDEWQRALAQFFRVVRRFNARNADPHEQMALLEVLSHVDESWHEPMSGIITALRAQREEQARDSAQLAARLLGQLCTLRTTRKAADRAAAEALQAAVDGAFRKELRARERSAHDALLRIYRHQRSELDVEALGLQQDLFDIGEWYRWGLGRKQLALAGAATGALAGAAADAAFAGLSAGVGTATGAAAGAAGAWFGSRKLVQLKVRGIAAGGFEARAGPVKDPNFPYVLLGRLLLLHEALRLRTHANRDVLRIAGEAARGSVIERALEALDAPQRKRFNAAMRRLQQHREDEELFDALLPLFNRP
jgi:hypothetical protein